ncbi:uncharacterized protein LOC126781063 isoform X2 [Nymphalis io]|uniref:uncharacterized protein LOC126781063 isoform X2 n=1 Tax=Inachis io TaxID=171585 RepID=UPI002166FAC6|nr:uncharacterized protein LOC126781063 isoform X2 [Nymphalis io]
MVVCELDQEVSGEVLGRKIPVWQALLLHRVLPSCGGLVLYLIVVCYDITLVYEHINKGDKAYCYLIFWWIEAVYAAREQDEERTREALSRAREPSSMELYLFLQAFIHCAPHAIINILDMMARYANPAFDKITLQAVSMIAASLRMASTATMYRRFEREKLCGRKYPWNINKNKVQNENENEENIEKTDENQEDDSFYEPIMKRQSSISQNNSSNRDQVNSDLIQFSPRSSELQSTFYDDDIVSTSEESSDYLPQARNEELESDDEYVRPISIIDKVAPRRRDTHYTIERVYVPAPPVTPAPRPGSFAVWAERLVENAESIPTWLSAPPRRKHWEVIQDEPDIPRRIPRSYMRGLEPQDATAALINFLGWYAFFVARLLSIAAFIDFFPFVAIIILMSHYQVMLLFLIVPQASTVKRAFYVFLAFIYLFCLMEFKIRFRHVRVWHMFWIIVCTVEIVVFISVWATVDNKLHNWWRSYIVIVTIVSMVLSYLLFLVYFLLLQPRETVVCINNNNTKNFKK